jgi:hypothetical protein
MSEASAPTTPVEPMMVVRLSSQMYRALEKKVNGSTILDRAATDSGVDAGYKLGIQHVLRVIREELVVE